MNNGLPDTISTANVKKYLSMIWPYPLKQEEVIYQIVQIVFDIYNRLLIFLSEFYVTFTYFTTQTQYLR